MALFRYSFGGVVSRGAGKSSLQAAAYVARERYRDERLGETFNYRFGAEHSPLTETSPITEASDHILRHGRHAELGSRQEVLFSGLYAPAGAPDWCRGAANIETFWNRAEAAERRRDAQLAERIIIALPKELTLEQNIWALQDHVREFTRQGRVVQVAIHSAEPEHDERNLHAHLLVSSRSLDANGLKATKSDEQQARYTNRREYVEHMRERWAQVANRHLERHGLEERLDHRSYQRQGLDREPTLHLGPGDAAKERQGIRTPAGDHNREVAERNAQRERERQALDDAIRAAHTATAKARQPDDVSQVRDATAEAHGSRQQDRQQQREERPEQEQKAPSGFRHAEGSFPAAALGAIAAQQALHASVEDFARQLSPQYAKALADAAQLEKAQHKAQEDVDRTGRRATAAQSQAERRLNAMGWFKKVLHTTGIWTDTEITRLANEEKKQEYWKAKNADTLRDVNSQLARAQRAVDAERQRIWDSAVRNRRELQTHALEQLSPRQRAEVLRFFDKAYSGGRELTAADIAREQSLAYQRAEERVATIAKDLDKSQHALRLARRDLLQTEAQIEDRRKALHILPADLAAGRFSDRTLTNLVSVARKEKLNRDAAEMRVADMRERLDEAEKAAARAFEAARPETEKELRRRRDIAAEARQTFAEIRATERQEERQQQRHRSRGISM